MAAASQACCWLSAAHRVAQSRVLAAPAQLVVPRLHNPPAQICATPRTAVKCVRATLRAAQPHRVDFRAADVHTVPDHRPVRRPLPGIGYAADPGATATAPVYAAPDGGIGVNADYHTVLTAADTQGSAGDYHSVLTAADGTGADYTSVLTSANHTAAADSSLAQTQVRGAHVLCSTAHATCTTCNARLHPCCT